MPSLRTMRRTLSDVGVGHEEVFVQCDQDNQDHMIHARRVNDMVIRFANVNGTGSASANELFARAIFRMGVPISSKNIFPSNIQGLPTWYEIRVSDKGYVGLQEAVAVIVGVNPQTGARDIVSIRQGGYFVYDDTKKLRPDLIREDSRYNGVPMMRLCMDNYDGPRHQQLFKNIVCVGALSV